MSSKYILSWLISAATILMSFSSSAQISVTATGGDLGPTSYLTLSDAFSAINAGTHMGAINIAITNNTTEPSSVTPLLKSAGTSNYSSILIHPTGGNWTINSAATPTADRGIIEFSGADNVTIDGDDPTTQGVRNLTIQAQTSTNSGVACIRLSSNSTSGADGADNNTIKNCIIIGSRNSATSTVTNYGINMSNYSTSSMTTGASKSINTTIENNEIRRTYYAIYANGANASYLNTGTIILNNIIGSSIADENIGYRGIHISYSSTNGTGAALIQGNDIRVGAVAPNGQGYSKYLAGIELKDNNAGCIIQKNNIHDIMQPSTSGFGAYGIYMTSPNSNNGIKILNNFIRDIVASNRTANLSHADENYGIRIEQAVTGLIVNHNTIALLAPNSIGSNTNTTSACISITVAGAKIAEFRNNILINNNPSTQAMGFYTVSTGNLVAFDNNNYYMANGGAIGYYSGGMRTTLSDWKTITTQDGNSLNINPAFISATDLHIISSGTFHNALESAGAATSVTSITTDIDGETRPGPTGSINNGGTAPDIGADEFDGTPIGAPLYIQLKYITAVNIGKRNRIAWESVNETGADYYMIEKSTDGKSFFQHGIVSAKRKKASYTYWDEKPNTGINYYRLKMQHTNGAFTYSKIAEAAMENKDEAKISVYPNPAIDEFTVEITGTDKINGTISISDISGKEIYKKNLAQSKTTIASSNMIPGIYFIKLQLNAHTEIIKITKQ